DAIQCQFPVIVIIKTGNEIDNGCFTCACMPDECDSLPGFRFQADLFQNCCLLIAEADMVKYKMSCCYRQIDCMTFIYFFLFFIHHIKYPLCAGNSGKQNVELVGKLI